MSRIRTRPPRYYPRIFIEQSAAINEKKHARATPRRDWKFPLEFLLHDRSQCAVLGNVLLPSDLRIPSRLASRVATCTTPLPLPNYEQRRARHSVCTIHPIHFEDLRQCTRQEQLARKA